mgnify:CR=1 FL=1
MSVITISRQSGSLGDELAAYLGEKLGCMVVTREYALKTFFEGYPEEDKEKLSESARFFLNKAPGTDLSYKDILVESLRKLSSEKENLIVKGLGGCVALRGDPGLISCRIYAGEKTRAQRIARQFNIGMDEASSTIAIGDRKHKRFVSILYDADLNSPDLYDISINTEHISVEEAASSILSLCEKKEKRMEIRRQTDSDDSIDHQSETPVFKNPTEEEFARILDMYGIEWMYEPKTFPIEWDAEGNIKMAFSPDFYLPKFNIYLELTTMDQKYVTKKNKKARMVMDLYPGTIVKIVYKKDFRELAERLKMFGG